MCGGIIFLDGDHGASVALLGHREVLLRRGGVRMLLNLDRHVGSLCVGRAGSMARPGVERRGDKRTSGGRVDMTDRV